MKIKYLDENSHILAEGLSEALQIYIKEHGTKGLCWFCANQYKVTCGNDCDSLPK